MLRFHVHVGVESLDQSIAFYSAMFGAAPVRREGDYAKWQLENPRLNFAISARGAPIGVNHLGFEAESAEELAGLEAHAKAAAEKVVIETDTGCCYARSDKAWVDDPQGVSWENFLTHASLSDWGAGAVSPIAIKGAETRVAAPVKNGGAACGPTCCAG